MKRELWAGILSLVAAGCGTDLPSSSRLQSRQSPERAAPHVSSVTTTVEQALAKFRELPFYHVEWIAQDTDDANIFGVHTKDQDQDLRSEQVYPPFVLSPRRQTDAYVRQLHALLPASLTRRTAFVVGDRLAQNPEAYLPYLASRKELVIAGSFMGIGSVANREEYEEWAKGEHARELGQLEATLLLARALGLRVVNVTYAMGDSTGAFAMEIRNEVDARYRALLSRYGLSSLHTPLSWGADETMAMAMAKLLPQKKIRIHYENPSSAQWYDGGNSASAVLESKLEALGLVAAQSNVDMELALFSRREGGCNDDFQPGDRKQASLDDAFAARFQSYSAARRQKLVIVDGRLFNGSWDAKSLLTKHTDYLAYGGWGTLGNKLGVTLATAKIVADNQDAREQLFLEAVAHDVFFAGYAESQRGKLFENIRGRIGGGWDNYSGWKDIASVEAAFEETNVHVTQRMKARYGHALGERTFRFTPQFWRMFEADVRMIPPLIPLPVGVYRTYPEFMDPTVGIFPSLTLSDL